MADFFTKSKPGTVWNRLYKERMTEEEFIFFEDGIGLDRIKNEQRVAFFFSVESVTDIMARLKTINTRQSTISYH